MRVHFFDPNMSAVYIHSEIKFCKVTKLVEE